MEGSSQLKIRWNNFPLTVSSSLEALRNNGDLVDTSLFCEGHHFMVQQTEKLFFLLSYLKLYSSSSRRIVLCCRLPAITSDRYLKKSRLQMWLLFSPASAIKTLMQSLLSFILEKCHCLSHNWPHF